MSTSRKLIVLLLPALMLLIGVPSASAAPSGTTTFQIVREPVTWTLSTEQCLYIQAPITGNGQRVEEITTREHADGSSEIISHDLVQGTAVDDTGGAYTFTYTNQASQQVPPSGSPIQVHMTDTFVLRGNGGANNLSVAFDWYWTYSPPAAYWPPVDNWQQVYTIGDPLHCDPI